MYSPNHVEQLLTVMLSCPNVVVVVWNQLQDTSKDSFGRTGLLDSEGREKPLLEVFQRLSARLKTSLATNGPGQGQVD